MTFTKSLFTLVCLLQSGNGVTYITGSKYRSHVTAGHAPSASFQWLTGKAHLSRSSCKAPSVAPRRQPRGARPWATWAGTWQRHLWGPKPKLALRWASSATRGRSLLTAQLHQHHASPLRRSGTRRSLHGELQPISPAFLLLFPQSELIYKTKAVWIHTASTKCGAPLPAHCSNITWIARGHRARTPCLYRWHCWSRWTPPPATAFPALKGICWHAWEYHTVWDRLQNNQRGGKQVRVHNTRLVASCWLLWSGDGVSQTIR